MRNQVNTGYCCEWLICILGSVLGVWHGEPGYYMLLMLAYHVFLTHLVYQKRKPQIDIWILSVLHIQSQEKILFIVNNDNTCYCYYIFPCILTTSGMQKTEATNRQQFSKI